jgi:tetratricopeptide (TPR) repeat protein
MADSPRIEDLRRRVQKDPASIAFAQLAEEYRRAGQCSEAVDVCLAGLSVHPGYLSARVTLGRAFVELDKLDEAQREFEIVLKGAPENLAAIRGLAEIHHRRGALSEALSCYRAALTLARNDPELQETVNDLETKLAPARTADPADGLSLEQMQHEMAQQMPPPALRETPATASAPLTLTPPHASTDTVSSSRSPASSAVEVLPPPADPERDRAIRTVAALEEWLAAFHVARADRHP